jgi:hypothetical protein
MEEKQYGNCTIKLKMGEDLMTWKGGKNRHQNNVVNIFFYKKRNCE